MAKRKVIVFTDGDQTAYEALSQACDELGCHPLRASQGNPTPLAGRQLVRAVLEAPKEPVVVMVDDRGDAGPGPGEAALADLTRAPELEVLGVVAVAANTRPVRGVDVTRSVDQHASLTTGAVDKEGRPVPSQTLKGDTVDVLQAFRGPIIGLGDPGKMQGHDSLAEGVPATRRALLEILRTAEGNDAKSPV